ILVGLLEFRRLDRDVADSFETRGSNFSGGAAALSAARRADLWSGRRAAPKAFGGRRSASTLPLGCDRFALVDLIHERLHSCKGRLRISRSSRRARGFWTRGLP